MSDCIEIQLTSDDALVLFEFASRFTEADSLSVEHGGERAALWRLCAALEKVLPQPFLANYKEQLQAARVRLAASAGLMEGEP